jgi:hypothetical protein
MTRSTGDSPDGSGLIAARRPPALCFAWDSVFDWLTRDSFGGDHRLNDQKSMQRPPFSQSPYRVGSGPLGPPISGLRDGAAGKGLTSVAGEETAGADAAGTVLSAGLSTGGFPAAGGFSAARGNGWTGLEALNSTMFL